MNSKLLRIPAIVGCIIHSGFAIWHFFVPQLYRWFDYVPSMPDELKNAITATNFFLAAALLVLGVESLVITVAWWEHRSVIGLTLWGMGILWVLRVGYQLLRPQGTMIPGLPVGLLIVFSITALCFLIPAIVLQAIRK